MKALSFFSRFAFICNIFFVVCLIVQRTHDFIGSADISSLVITLGWLLAPFVNLVVCIWYGIQRLARRPLTIPLWLVITNFLFLLMQLFVHFILPA